MKTFNYTMRDKNGSLKQGTLKAVDRHDALQQIKDMAGMPISLNETTEMKPWLSKWLRYAPLVTFPALLISVLIFSSIRRMSDRHLISLPNPSTFPTNLKTSLPSPNGNRHPITTPNVKQKTVPLSPTSPSTSLATSRIHENLTSPTFEKKDLHTVRAPFKTLSEQVLGMIASVPTNMEIPPLPDLSNSIDADFFVANSNTLEIFEEDDDKLVNRIENVAWAKADIADLVKQGWKPNEVINHFFNQHNENSNTRKAIVSELRNRVHENAWSSEEVSKLIKSVNVDLESRGLLKIVPQELELHDSEQESVK